jgi:hypothetical protein
LETNPEQARAIARRHVSRYLDLPNYTNNWRRLGFTDDDLVAQGSDRLVDAMVAWGDVEAIIAAFLKGGTRESAGGGVGTAVGGPIPTVGRGHSAGRSRSWWPG